MLALRSSAALLPRGASKRNMTNSIAQKGTVSLHCGKGGSVDVTPVGCGIWSWGDDKGVWGWKTYDTSYGESTVRSAFFEAISHGPRLFDTGETYGSGVSEKLLGSLIAEARNEGLQQNARIATKFQPGKWANGSVGVREAMVRAARESTQRIGVDVIDLYQIHSAQHPSPFSEQAHGLADVFEAGLANAVGVSNFSNEEMIEVYNTLLQRGVQLASNQVEFSILRQLPEENGMLDNCKHRNIQLIGYSPIAMGRLSGKYDADNPPQGRRGFGNASWDTVSSIVSCLRSIGQAHGNRTPAQVALNWVCQKGVLPIPGAKNKAQAEENSGAMGWSITEEETSKLQQMGASGRLSNWQHG